MALGVKAHHAAEARLAPRVGQHALRAVPPAGFPIRRLHHRAAAERVARLDAAGKLQPRATECDERIHPGHLAGTKLHQPGEAGTRGRVVIGRAGDDVLQKRVCKPHRLGQADADAGGFVAINGVRLPRAERDDQVVGLVVLAKPIVHLLERSAEDAHHRQGLQHRGHKARLGHPAPELGCLARFGFGPDRRAAQQSDVRLHAAGEDVNVGQETAVKHRARALFVNIGRADLVAHVESRLFL